MLAKLQNYPRAYWILLSIYLFNRIGASFIWPFMTIFIREQTNTSAITLPSLLLKSPAVQALGLSASVLPDLSYTPLSTITPLLSIQAIASLIGSPIVASFMDRFGRKKMMFFGLIAYCTVLLMMSSATQLWQWAILMAIYGVMHPIFYVGTHAMVADLSTPENRTGAFAILRTVSNLSIALGPAIGGVLIARSHNFAYYGAVVINLLSLIPFALVMSETLSTNKLKDQSQANNSYLTMLRDYPFIAFIAIFTLLEIAIALVFNLLSVYTKENFGILENQYGQLLAINAGMVVLFQYGITRLTSRYRHLTVMIAGALFYVVGLVGFAQSTILTHFAASMVIMTVGELIAMPTANALVANMAPADMRARYLGVLSLTFTFGTGLGPIFGGLLSDRYGPPAIWYGGAFASLLAAGGFAALSYARNRRLRSQAAVQPKPLVKPIL
jgi:MFS family permease